MSSAQLVVQEQPVPQDRRVREEMREPQAILEHKVIKDQVEHLVPMEQPDRQDPQEMLEHLDHQVSRVLRAQEDRQGLVVIQVQ